MQIIQTVLTILSHAFSIFINCYFSGYIIHSLSLNTLDRCVRYETEDIPSLYREHFNKVMAAHAHASNPDAVVREETEVFLEDAEKFKRYVKRTGSDVKEFDWDSFKKIMTNYMHVTADLLNAQREL
tara:strand:+ start:108 stop:488 length:381 start_codon:yes stop_codon:yes gene_type:complete